MVRRGMRLGSWSRKSLSSFVGTVILTSVRHLVSTLLLLMVVCPDLDDDPNFNMNLFTNEADMLDAWLSYMTTTDYDLITAWNGHGYDLPQLYWRVKANGLDTDH